MGGDRALVARPVASATAGDAANPVQGFVLAYVCGILWYAGTCYWIYSVMRHYGGVNAPAAVGILILFCMYLAIYHGVSGLLVCWLAGSDHFSRRALLLSPVVWVAVELARTRITGFPWDLLGISQVDNIPLARIATVTGVYGLSFEIMVVNAALAAAFLVPRDKRKKLLLAAIGAAVVLQSGRLIPAPPIPPDRTATLVQANVPILEGADWTRDYFTATLRDLASISITGPNSSHLVVWPESPAPFYTTDPFFRDAISNLARQANTWVLTGSIGIRNAPLTPGAATEIYNSGALVSPAGEWTS